MSICGVDVRQAIGRIQNVDVWGKNTWTSGNVSKNFKISENFYIVLDLSYVFLDLISTLPCIFVILFFGLRRLRCNKQ